MSVFTDDEKGVFALTRELEGQQMTLLINRNASEISEKEIPELQKYMNYKNLVTEQIFFGKLSAFELAVLINL